MPKSAWLVRAGNDNELIDIFLSDGFVAIGWPEVGNLSSVDSRDRVKELYRDGYPKRKDGRVTTDSGQLYTFAHRFEEGDWILTYDKNAREYHVGQIAGSYSYAPDEAPEEYPHVRPVEWEGVLDRDEFTTPTKNTLGSALTVFSVESCIDEIRALLEGQPSEEASAEQDEPPLIEEVESRSEELISDIVANVDPYDFEELVAAVLRAMGYTAETTRKGPDYGVDIVAHPDALGFEDPQVKVQVKQTKNTVGNEKMGRFLGTLNEDEKGLYVSTGGFTKPALREVRGKDRNVTLLDRDDFIDLLLEHYGDLEQEYKSMVPLKQIYVPTVD